MTDLIALKTEEYDKLPGLILGLDGWILRSVPKELRRNFLSGYEKLLRIAFHPDRYTDTTAKNSRQTYLQTVSEAVEFMCRDEFSFELASDNVPTKRNPLVALNNSVLVRDEIISRINGDLESANRARDKAVTERISALKDLTKANRELRKVENRNGKLWEALVAGLRSNPVPIGAKYHVVSGFYVDSAKIQWSDLNHSRFDEQIKAGNPERATLRIRNFVFGKNRLETALSKTHLIEYLAEHQIGLLLRKPDLHETDLIRIQALRDFTLPFYTTGFLLLIRSETDRRLFYVELSDYAKSPNRAMLDGHKREIHMMRSKWQEAVRLHREAAGERDRLLAERKLTKDNVRKEYEDRIEKLNRTIGYLRARRRKTKAKP